MDEIVIIMGYQGAGKSTIVKEFTDQGYSRINRDITGGSLDGQVKFLKEFHAKGTRKFVLDNTYITIESRESIVATAKAFNIPIRCIWLKTSIEDCQVNICMRMMEKHGKILSPDELKKSKDPNDIPIVALFGARNRFEGKDKNNKHPGKQTPTVAEGFSKVETREFKRVWGSEYKNKGLILDFDDNLRTSTGPNPWPEDVSHVKILPNRKEVLEDWKSKGFRLLGASNQSAIAKGLKEEVAVACFEETLKLLGVDIEYQYCPHKIPPLTCYCRKPAVGMLVYFIHKYKLDVSQSYFVGDSTSDKSCAERTGMIYAHPDQFFKK